MAFLRGIFIFSFIIGILSPASASAGLFSNFSNAFFEVFRSNVVEEVADTPKVRAKASLFAPVFQAMAQSPISSGGSPSDSADFPSLFIIEDSAVVSPTNPQGTMSDGTRDRITTYIVKEGDNISAIASSFGVTVNTILWTNDIRDAKLIKPGDILIILPVSGVKYAVKKGDTLQSIAKKFRGSVDDITQFNGLAVDEILSVGTDIIIPDGEFQENPSPAQTPKTPASVSRFAGLPEIIGYFARPIIGGRNSRATQKNPHGLHGFNGIDLASSCGFPIMASAGGTVIIARSSGWNGGYGKYVVISHPNGVQTLYGHMSSVFVSPGQTVAQGFAIGAIGSTGNSTGCHVHFEIRGAKNPF